jgi:hypothetical protein
VSLPDSRIALLEQKRQRISQKLARLGCTVNELPGDAARLTGSGFLPID